MRLRDELPSSILRNILPINMHVKLYAMCNIRIIKNECRKGLLFLLIGVLFLTSIEIKHF